MSTAVRPPSVLWRLPVLGTGATIATPETLGRAVEKVIRDRWDALEDVAALGDDDSERAALGRGELELADASPELRSLVTLALEWSERTGGDFTPYPPGGGLELIGIVKALAMRAAAVVLDRAEATPWFIEVGGDVVCARDASLPVRIQDPRSAGRMLTEVTLGGEWRALATSGVSARGEHIWRSRTDGDLVQVTVVCGDIVTADVLATAILAGGVPALERTTQHEHVEVLTVDREGGLLVTPGLRAALLRDQDDAAPA